MSAPTAPRVRVARAAVGHLSQGALFLENYLAGPGTTVPGAAVDVAGSLRDWTARDEVLRRLAAAGDAAPVRTLGRLVSAGILLEERSLLAVRDARFARTWRWGPYAGAVSRRSRDLPYTTDEEALEIMAARARRTPSPPLLPPPPRHATALPAPRVRAGVLRHLLRRRSTRAFGAGPIARADLSDVLFAGLGVRELRRDRVQGLVPLKLVPSGGARNPIDGYLYARRVDGLPPGVYRYCGVTRSLDLVSEGAPTAPSRLLGGQAWTDGAAAVIFLVATYARSSWKYRDPAGYRVVLVEAGHIAQNLLVTACDLGLAATPTGAFSDTVAEAALGTAGPDRGLLHAVVLGPAPAHPSAPRRPLGVTPASTARNRSVSIQRGGRRRR
ncbi:MAG: SagB/ThcOx family dehydrogenase [Anaeromyxobacter sp.]